MTRRVVFISAATSPALRQARFDDGDPIDDIGAARARAAAGLLPSAVRAVVSPSPRARGTAAALGLHAAGEPALAGWNVGRWRGRGLDEVGAGEPESVARWLTDPSAAPHGGESLHELCGRVGSWLEGLPETPGRTLAVVEPETVRAAVVHALGLPPSAFWRLDVPPLTATEFSGRTGRWNLRLGRPLTAPEAESGH